MRAEGALAELIGLVSPLVGADMASRSSDQKTARRLLGKVKHIKIYEHLPIFKEKVARIRRSIG